MKIQEKNPVYKATRNACKLCTPLGASLAFKGVRGTIPMLHGSQGCATYIRRYLISHYKEPIDIASTNFSEETAVFGGGINLKTGLDNIIRQYAPEMIGIATTCLSETIGDDVSMFLDRYLREKNSLDIPKLVHVSTPSYSGTHRKGYNDAVLAMVRQLADPGFQNDEAAPDVNIFPGMVSPADLRHLKEIMADFGLKSIMLPDYSETLDGGLWGSYQKIPQGGTPIDEIAAMGGSHASIEFGRILSSEPSAGKYLEETCRVPCHAMGLPMGIGETDILMRKLNELSGQDTPEKYVGERARLVDAYVDGHKYTSGKTAAVFGDEELVVGLAGFLAEIGISPIICATGGVSGMLTDKIREVSEGVGRMPLHIAEDADFVD